MEVNLKKKRKKKAIYKIAFLYSEQIDEIQIYPKLLQTCKMHRYKFCRFLPKVFLYAGAGVGQECNFRNVLNIYKYSNPYMFNELENSISPGEGNSVEFR